MTSSSPLSLCLPLVPSARAHHGWSSFDQDRPLYLEGKVVKARWQNPHAELDLEVAPGLKLPADLASRAAAGAERAGIDGKALLAKATVPHAQGPPVGNRARAADANGGLEGCRDQARHHGFRAGLHGLRDEKGEAVLRAEYLFVDGKAYGLRSSPA